MKRSELLAQPVARCSVCRQVLSIKDISNPAAIVAEQVIERHYVAYVVRIIICAECNCVHQPVYKSIEATL